MKVTFKKEELLLAITKSLGCVSTEKTINSIEGILITTIGEDKCQLCAYDLEKGIKIMIGAQVESGGVIVMNGNKLSNIVNDAVKVFRHCRIDKDESVCGLKKPARPTPRADVIKSIGVFYGLKITFPIFIETPRNQPRVWKFYFLIIAPRSFCECEDSSPWQRSGEGRGR